MLTLIGLSIIAIIVALLLTEKVSPVIAMVLVPLIGVVVAGFDLEQIKTFYTDGTRSVIQIVIMFIFAILFFGTMSDVGLFKPLINALIKLTRGNIVAVSVGTVFVSVVAQLDGAGATTFLLVVPALIPLYRKLHMNPYLLFLLLAASAGVINMLPWGGPTGRVATVLKMDVNELYQPLFTVQVIAIVLITILAIFLGLREKKRIVKELGALPTIETSLIVAENEQNDELARPHLFWVNVGLFVLTMAVLFSGVLPSGYVFMIATALTLIINYRSPKEQMARINAHAGGAIMMASIILAAGTFLGILKGSGMLDAIANDIVKVLPQAMLPYLHIIIGILGIPLELVLSTDAYYFGLFPVVEQITSQAGVPPTAAGYAMLIGSIVGTFVTPLSPALWMGLGLAQLSMGKHIRYSFFWIWGISLLTLAASIMIGVIPL
ncbi:CitMHS family transporter [Alysiella filiformis]|uniref:Citrate-Mg2+:H+ or citrate-Ca2+:H+ symporter, CitMHS family n=1 Tax=Alysiella filiformis DSM 16848 TaxID=1120981 RepID=A0A286EFV4_9NEIS|nr:citrate:proton symporter [Alysiella filiformis]QMT30473.1 citrate transporter [Alysiella filiformis]UBQ56545.1 citrate:proton symporter [Alysiella filiformis DSM 16848]SOD69791.1 citrate-Mg2+:H+ or citrate-Ca2+:H+ symporter, CitMHS family [Alysiella filiformis DSM 16848]